MNHKQIDGKNGYRVAWFIPIELCMSWCILTLVVAGYNWAAIAVFACICVPAFIAMQMFLPQPVYKRTPIPHGPNPDNYNFEDKTSAKRYDRDFRQWTKKVNELLSNSKLVVDHNERRPLPTVITKILGVKTRHLKATTL